MIDLDSLIASELDRMLPLPSGKRADWQEIVDRAAPRRRRAMPKGRLVSVFAAATVAIVLIALATPVGAAIVRGLDDFATWISGEPGQPASPAEQQAFQQENERSWSGFAPGTELRRLIQTSVAGTSYTLYGFRSGDELCLRLTASGAVSQTSTHCAPVRALQTAEEPALVVVADEEFGSTNAPPNDDGYVPPVAGVSFGIVSDGVARVLLDADDGTRNALVASNAFLYVADHPRPGARIRSAEAVAGDGSIVALPFESAPYGLTDLAQAPDNTALGGPWTIDRYIPHGTIGWIEAREPRGESLPVEFRTPQAVAPLSVLWGRLIKPDPGSSDRVGVVLVDTTAGGRKGVGLCLLFSDVVGGSCGTGADFGAMFDHPLQIERLSPVDEFDLVSGVASDDVVRIKVFEGTGETVDVPLTDNVFLTRIDRAAFPIRLVAYDAEQRVIDVQLEEGDGATSGAPLTAHTSVRERFRVSAADGTTAIVKAGYPAGGYLCYAITYGHGEPEGGCTNWPVDYSDGRGGQDPLMYVHDIASGHAVFLSGLIPPEVASVTVSFPDGTVADAKAQDGFVVYAIPPAELVSGRTTLALRAYDRSGEQIAQRGLAVQK